MFHFLTKLNKKAQHTLEYGIVLILIMTGIIIMGPYIIRGWNAQMKGWEDSVEDSLNEPMTTSSNTDLFH